MVIIICNLKRACVFYCLFVFCAVEITAQKTAPIRNEVVLLTDKMQKNKGIFNYYEVCRQYYQKYPAWFYNFRSYFFPNYIPSNKSIKNPPPYSEGEGYDDDVFSKNENYRIFQQLNRIATDDELLHLVQHGKPLVKCYAFWGIVMRREHFSKDILNRLYQESLQDKRKLKNHAFPFSRSSHSNTGACVYKLTVARIFYEILHENGHQWMGQAPIK